MIRRVAVATVFLLAISACGGGTGNRIAAGAKQLSKADYIKAADTICESATQQSSNVAPPANSNDLSEWTTYLARLIPISKDELGRLEKIAPPDADRGMINRWLGRIAEANSASDRARKGAAANSLKAFQDAGSNVNAFIGEANQISAKYGLDHCGALG